MSLLFLTTTIDAAMRPKGQPPVWRSVRGQKVSRERVIHECIAPRGCMSSRLC